MKNIFDAMTLNRLPLKNRLWRSATWLALADDEGNLTKSLLDTYERLAAGGVGAIITGITTVSPHDALLYGIAQFHSDRFIDQHRRLTSIVHEYDCKIFLQTAIVDGRGAVDENEVVALFLDAAYRAKVAGYDGIQLHAAHGFFLSQFIEYDRGAILGVILDKLRAELGRDFPIIAKINGENCLDACRVMVEHGIDAIEISGDFTSRKARAHANEGYFKDYALEVKRHLDVPIILVGGHRSIEEMNQLLIKTPIEFLSMSRALVREPSLINRWKGGDIRPSECVGCNACYRTPGHQCIFVLGGRG